MNSKLVAHVVSIWPLPLVARRTLFQPFLETEKNVWNVPAASAEEPQVIVIHQYKQLEPNGSGGYNTTIIEADALAADLVNELAAHKISAAGRPGIFVADDVQSQFDGAVTIDQVKRSKSYAAAVRAQAEFALAMVAEARELFRKGKAAQITDLHFAMANLLGLRNEQWQERINVETVSTRCFACQELIPMDALVCRNCKEVLDPVGLEQQREARRLMSGVAVDPLVLDMASLEALTAPSAPPLPPPS